MKRFLILFPALAIALALASIGWSPKWEDPQLPRGGAHGSGIGLQVCLAEVDALGKENTLCSSEIIGFPASRATRDQFSVNVSKVAQQIAGPTSPYNLDIAMMKMVNRGAQVETQSMTCVCAAAIYNNGIFYGCNIQACAGCAYCRVRAIK